MTFALAMHDEQLQALIGAHDLVERVRVHLIDRLRRAIGLLEGLTPQGPRPQH